MARHLQKQKDHRVSIGDIKEWNKELEDPNRLLVVEIYSTTFGACSAITPHINQIMLTIDNAPNLIRFLTVNVSKLEEDARAALAQSKLAKEQRHMRAMARKAHLGESIGLSIGSAAQLTGSKTGSSPDKTKSGDSKKDGDSNKSVPLMTGGSMSLNLSMSLEDGDEEEDDSFVTAGGAAAMAGAAAVQALHDEKNERVTVPKLERFTGYSHPQPVWLLFKGGQLVAPWAELRSPNPPRLLLLIRRALEPNVQAWWEGDNETGKGKDDKLAANKNRNKTRTSDIVMGLSADGVNPKAQPAREEQKMYKLQFAARATDVKELNALGGDSVVTIWTSGPDGQAISIDSTRHNTTEQHPNFEKLVLAEQPEDLNAELTITLDVVGPPPADGGAPQPILLGKVVTTYAALMNQRAETEPITIRLASKERKDAAAATILVWAKNIGFRATVPMFVGGKNLPTPEQGRSLVLVASVKDNLGRWPIHSNLGEAPTWNGTDVWWKGLTIAQYSSRDMELRLALYDVATESKAQAGVGGDNGPTHTLIADGLFNTNAFLACSAVDGLVVPLGGLKKDSFLLVRHANVGTGLPPVLAPPAPAAGEQQPAAATGDEKSDPAAAATSGGAAPTTTDSAGSGGSSTSGDVKSDPAAPTTAATAAAAVQQKKMIVVAVAGKRNAGKTLFASMLHDALTKAGLNASDVLNRSLADSFKAAFAQKFGHDLERLRNDRAYKESLRTEMNNYFEQTYQAEPEREVLGALAPAVDGQTRVVIISDHRLARDHTAFAKYARVVWPVRIEIDDAVRNKLGWTANPAVDTHFTETNLDGQTNWASQVMNDGVKATLEREAQSLAMKIIGQVNELYPGSVKVSNAAAAPTSPAPIVKGQLILTVVEAKGLRDTEIMGKMDPFLVVRTGSEEAKSKEKTNAGVNPKFNESFKFDSVDTAFDPNVKFSVWDSDITANDMCGSVDVPIAKLIASIGAPLPICYQIQKDGKWAGELYVVVNSFKPKEAPAPAVTVTVAAAPIKSDEKAPTPATAAAPAPAINTSADVKTTPAVGDAKSPKPVAPVVAGTPKADAKVSTTTTTTTDSKAADSKAADSKAADSKPAEVKRQTTTIQGKLPENKGPLIGKLVIVVMTGRKLKDMDTIGKMDPFVVVRIGTNEYTGAEHNGAGTEPVFNEMYTFAVDGTDDALHASVWDEDPGSDDHVGSVDIPLKQLISSSAAVPYPIASKDGKRTGELLIRCESWTAGAVVPQSQIGRAGNAPAAGAKNKKKPAATAAAATAPAPVPAAATATATATVNKPAATPTPAAAAGGGAAPAPTANGGAAPAAAATAAAAAAPVSPLAGKLIVTVLSGKNLKDMDSVGKMDPYLTLKCGKQEFKGKEFENAGTNPTFNETFMFQTDGSDDALHVTAWDEDPGADDLIGSVDIPLKTLIGAAGGAAALYPIADKKGARTGELLIKCDSFTK